MRHFFALLSLLALPLSSFGFGYVFANETRPYSVTHAPGYTGSGGVLNVTVGINPSNATAAQQVIPMQNMIYTFNTLQTTTGNLSTDPGMGGGQFDWESVMLHELGHSLGLSHVNAASESGLTGADRNYTKAGEGADTVFNLNAGGDGIRGSGDDLRGDDVNLNYFKLTDNNPFTLAGTVDSTTYELDVGLLPGGDTFSANGDRDVAPLYGLLNTEAVMQQGTFGGEIQRTLAADDVAGILYANAGLDEIAGTADDYTLNLVYAGLTTSADIVVTGISSGFAVSYSSGSSIGSGGVHGDTHFRAIPSSPGSEPGGFFYNTSSNWFYNDDLNHSPNSGFYVPEPSTAALLFAGLFLLRGLRSQRSSYA